MKNLIKSPYVFVKWLIVILAAGNLVFLFVFNYQLPGFPSLSRGDDASISNTIGENAESTETAEATFQIHVPEEPLNYDSTKALDLMDGVFVTDLAGEEQKDLHIFSVIKPGDTRKEKIIKYSVTDENGTRVTTQRSLILGDNYTGPIIDLKGDMPELSADDLPVLVSLLITKNLIYADDGFGKDITSAVTSSVKATADASGNTIVTLSITNMVNDSYSVDVSVHTGISSGPRIELTTNHVTLNVGDTFSFYNYIAAAQDAAGNDLHNKISIDGFVDTSTPGEYTMEFYCIDSAGTKSNVEILNVTVR